VPGDRLGSVSGCARWAKPAAEACGDGRRGDVLNGLGFSNRRLRLVARFFATKLVETTLVEELLGPRIMTEQLHFR
jgi:hypothetical protein